MRIEAAKTLLRNRGFRQQDIADYCGLSQTMISFVLNGKRNTHPEAAGKILILAEIVKQINEIEKSILGRYKIS